MKRILLLLLLFLLSGCSLKYTNGIEFSAQETENQKLSSDWAVTPGMIYFEAFHKKNNTKLFIVFKNAYSKSTGSIRLSPSSNCLEEFREVYIGLYPSAWNDSWYDVTRIFLLTKDGIKIPVLRFVQENEEYPLTRREVRSRDSSYGWIDMRVFFPASCADLEGAELLLDGFVMNGVPLEPLRIKMHYTDFSEVPR